MTKKSYEDIVKERDELFKEVQFLEHEAAKIKSKLDVKRAALKKICICNERTGMFEYSICNHCGEHH
jgi:hypothetical protein